MEDDLFSGLCPTSELEAVNGMLDVVGESPVSTLDEITTDDSTLALQRLRRVNRAFQTEGWNFNTDLAMPLKPAADGTISLPANCVGFRPIKRLYTGMNLTMRQGKVYDRWNNTFTIKATTIYADIVSLLNFEDMPEAARWYVFVRAARMMQDAVLGDAELHQFEAADEQQARALFLSREAEDDDYNIVRDSPSVRAVTSSRYRYIF